MYAQCLAHCSGFKRWVTSPKTIGKETGHHTTRLAALHSRGAKSIGEKTREKQKWLSLGGAIIENILLVILSKFFTMRGAVSTLS